MFKSLDISASGMHAERMRLEVISSNIANANNTDRVNGEVYRRKQALLGINSSVKANFSDLITGVQVTKIIDDNTDYKLMYDPEHPDAIQEGELKGYVQLPNVDINTEIFDLMSAQRGFEANAKTFEALRDIINTSISIGKG